MFLVPCFSGCLPIKAGRRCRSALPKWGFVNQPDEHAWFIGVCRSRLRPKPAASRRSGFTAVRGGWLEKQKAEIWKAEIPNRFAGFCFLNFCFLLFNCFSQRHA